MVCDTEKVACNGLMVPLIQALGTVIRLAEMGSSTTRTVTSMRVAGPTTLCAAMVFTAMRTAPSTEVNGFKARCTVKVKRLGSKEHSTSETM